MYGITSWSSTSEHELKDMLSLSALMNKDGSYQAWIVGHDGITIHVPRCQIKIEALQNHIDTNQPTFTITIPEGAKL